MEYRMLSKYDAVSEKLNEVWMNSFQEDDYGSCQEEGFAAALIITDTITGIIVEDSQGFVDYWTYETEQETRDRWDERVTVWQQTFNPEAAYA
jgi:hypothetical protein